MAEMMVAAAPGAAVAPVGKPETTPVERPAHVPEKFWNAEKGEVNTEALLGSYTELEKSIGSKPKTPEIPGKTPEGSKNTPDSAGLWSEQNMAKWTQEVEAHGSLTQESYDKILKEANIPRPMVDLWIEKVVKGGQQETAVEASKAVEQLGGPEAWAEIQSWAHSAYSPEDKAYINGELKAGGLRMHNAVKSLQKMYEEFNGKPAPRKVAGTKNPANEPPLTDMKEITRLMADPRYKPDHVKYDPEYRKSVLRRMGVN